MQKLDRKRLQRTQPDISDLKCSHSADTAPEAFVLSPLNLGLMETSLLSLLLQMSKLFWPQFSDVRSTEKEVVAIYKRRPSFNRQGSSHFNGMIYRD